MTARAAANDAPSRVRSSERYDGTKGPDWVNEALRAFFDELRRFVATTASFIRSPYRFSNEWFSGNQPALNPLGLLATALAVSGALGTIVPQDGDQTLWSALGQATLPYLYYVALGVFCHLPLRLAGSRRPLRATVAVTLFAGGGPGLFVALSIYAAVALHKVIGGDFEGSVLKGLPGWATVVLALVLIGPYLSFLVTLWLGLAGVHQLRRRWAAIALAFSLAGSGILLGELHRHRAIGLGTPHLVIKIPHRRGESPPLPDIWF